MARSKSSTKTLKSTLPMAPWIYINSSSKDESSKVAQALATLIPHARVYPDLLHFRSYGGKNDSNDKVLESTTRSASPNRTVMLFVTEHADVDSASQAADRLREAAIITGNNFTSVRLIDHSDETVADWGTNHLDARIAGVKVEAIAEQIFKWLFKVLTVPETLHLIPEADMRATDTVSFPDYEYCAINESCKHRKDAKLQFVALIVSKPEIGPDQRLMWRVVDRTGEANFYFKYRSTDSKATWDWVLKLQPGDRKALPRMPMVHIKEKKRVKLAKAPFRGAAAVVGGVGLGVKGVGKGLCWISDKVRMGPSGGQWIAEADLPKADAAATVGGGGEKRDIKIFNENGEKVWKEDDDAQSTAAGSIFDEKIVKDFC